MAVEEDLQEFLKIIDEIERHQKFNQIENLFPDEGPLRRQLYPKHMEFFKATATHRESAMIAANRIGKTVAAAYAMTCHLTGNYPEWWEGKRFDSPIEAWAIGQTGETTRDVVQNILLGRAIEIGTGLIPRDLIHVTTPRSGIPHAIKDVYIKHKNGGYSYLGFKSYDQGIQSFMGTAKHVIWADEEPPIDVYAECLTRTMTVDGIVISTFTPLMGMSEVVLSFLEQDENAPVKKFYVQVSWDDVPHLSKKDKDELWAALPAHQRDSRAKGIPDLGGGAVYPIPERLFLIDPIELQPWWPRSFGFDVGWHNTAAVWLAYNRDDNVCYLYSEYLAGHEKPIVHAEGIKARGKWIPGHCDPHANNVSQGDGVRVLDLFIDAGLDLSIADNAVEAGIYRVEHMLGTGQLKVFNTLACFLREYRKYRYDKHGKIVKKDDHLMDAMRYGIMAGVMGAKRAPYAEDENRAINQEQGMSATGGY